MVRNSFTLLEILISTAIIVLLSGFTLAQYSHLREKQKLDTQVQKVVQVLELARTKATSGDVSLCDSWKTVHPRLLGSFLTVSSGSHFQFRPDCTNPNPQAISHTFEQNIIFLTPTMQVRFDAEGYVNKAVCFSIKNESSNTCKYIDVNKAGLITSGECAECPPPDCPCL